MDFGEYGVEILLSVAFSVLIVVFANIPYYIAFKRSHPNTLAIKICGFVGILILPFWFVESVWGLNVFGVTIWGLVAILVSPFWFVALVWALIGPNRSKVTAEELSRVQLYAESPKQLDGPGTFRIEGVDKQSSFDTSLMVDAASVDNARVKAELKGIVVTKVTRIS